MSGEHHDCSTTPAIVAQVLADVAKHWGLSLHNLNGGRTPTQSDIRAIAQWYFHEKYCFGFSEIGRMFKKDHTTVLHNVKRIANFVRMHDDGSVNRLGSIARAVLAHKKREAG